MRIERVNSNKIRIFISKEDLREWNVDFNSVTGNTPAAQNMFWSMMERAEREVDFHAEGSQLIVEAVASNIDGFIMQVTKVSDEEAGANAARREKIKNNNYRIRRKVKFSNGSANYIYKFNNFDDLVEATKQISPRFLGQSKLYKFGGEFFLHITLGENEPGVAIDNTLIEYGRKIMYHAISDGFLSEYADVLIENSAVEALANNF
ncbi:MAG: adaptor protein MecA [Oscillospiraceae bacterium]|nr:adaptor protein MecA [Oscillospiraceae bacterium]